MPASKWELSVSMGIKLLRKSPGIMMMIIDSYLPWIYKKAGGDLAISVPLKYLEMQVISELLFLTVVATDRTDVSEMAVLSVENVMLRAWRTLALIPSTSQVKIFGVSTPQVKRTWRPKNEVTWVGDVENRPEFI